MENQRNEPNAVVLGGSLAGLLAARVLSRHCAKVTLIERDRYPSQPAPRNGVPQARHVHVILLRGLRILESLFPGFAAEVESMGGLMLDSADDFHWLTPGGLSPRFRSRVPFAAISRPAIDWIVQRRVRSLANVEIVESTDVTGLVRSGGRGVDGVTIRRRGGSGAECIAASLIVDASGRGSHTPEWLAGMGLEIPKATAVDGHFGYASRLYRRMPSQHAAWRAAYSQAAPPHVNRLGLAFPIEGDRWMVTLGGGGADYPPVREDHFMDFARSLPNPEIYNLIRTALPLGPIHGARSQGNRWVHYERVRMPEGLAVMGDAVCSFNPVYGQGMTMAGIGAELLEACCARGSFAGFQKSLAKAAEPAWTLATSEDYRYPGVTGDPAGAAAKLMHRYLDRVIARSCADPEVRRTLLEVFHMVRRPESLFRPSMFWKAARQRVPGTAAAAAAAAAQPELEAWAATRIGW
ncbi:MAG: FAD-dependent oxidoreductase [Bryobacteraceae bacterium]